MILHELHSELLPSPSSPQPDEENDEEMGRYDSILYIVKRSMQMLSTEKAAKAIEQHPG